jgi:hypothetical protein
MDTFFMDTVWDPLLALLGIVIPLGLAYLMLLFQACNPDCGRRKAPAICDEQRQEGMELSRAEEKNAAR